jgi:hypothetical protein
MDMLQIILRIICSLVLVYFVYKETGWATALCIGLLGLGVELLLWGVGELIQINKDILEHLTK